MQQFYYMLSLFYPLYSFISCSFSEFFTKLHNKLNINI